MSLCFSWISFCALVFPLGCSVIPSLHIMDLKNDITIAPVSLPPCVTPWACLTPAQVVLIEKWLLPPGWRFREIPARFGISVRSCSPCSNCFAFCLDLFPWAEGSCGIISMQACKKEWVWKHWHCLNAIRGIKSLFFSFVHCPGFKCWYCTLVFNMTNDMLIFNMTNWGLKNWPWLPPRSISCPLRFPAGLENHQLFCTKCKPLLGDVSYENVFSSPAKYSRGGCSWLPEQWHFEVWGCASLGKARAVLEHFARWALEGAKIKKAWWEAWVCFVLLFLSQGKVKWKWELFSLLPTKQRGLSVSEPTRLPTVLVIPPASGDDKPRLSSLLFSPGSGKALRGAKSPGSNPETPDGTPGMRSPASGRCSFQHGLTLLPFLPLSSRRKLP